MIFHVSLKSAVERYAKASQCGNAYSFYQREARTSGHVILESIKIKAFKVGGEWHISQNDFHLAMQKCEARKEQRRKNSDDLRCRIITGEEGMPVETLDGYYIKRGQFHFVVSSYQSARRNDDGTWYCTPCNSIADTEHNNPECHNCREGWGCNRDCTLSKILCQKCGAFSNV